MLAVARRVPVGEALPALGLLAIAVVALGPRPLLVGFAWLAWVTPRLVEVDLAEHRLPDAVVLPGYPVVLAALVLDGALTGSDVGGAVLAAAACGLVFLLLHVAGGMGFGDVKLAGVLGLYLGWLGYDALFVGYFLGALLGGVVGIGLLLARRVQRGTKVPYGPFMVAGAVLAVFVAGPLVHAYLHSTGAA